MSKDIVTSVNAQGKASADYDRARFEINVSMVAKTVGAAKATAEPVLAKVSAAIKKLSEEGVSVDKDSVKSNYSTSPQYEYLKGKSRLTGYAAAYTILFETTTIDKVADIQDVLTSIENAVVNGVDFILKDSESIKKLALKDAFEKVSTRFETECLILGKDKTDYEIIAWSANYQDGNNGRKTLGGAFAASASNSARVSPVEIEAGKAEVGVHLMVSYARKA